ncbi:probable ATP-dependent RNA helicase DDX28 [Amphiura filiformis]|uniref:probable ATP-dependent RNA helicase DDX28 n=1 Tax=Amphiura filiformis TaxID=82378 RepID=UPI003B213087
MVERMISSISAHNMKRFSLMYNNTNKCVSCGLLHVCQAAANPRILGHKTHQQILFYVTSAGHQKPTSETVIKVPKGLATKLESFQQQSTNKGPIKWKGKIFTARPGKLLLSAKRKEFNFYQHQKYDKFKPPMLASGGWKHKKSAGDYFTILAYKGNPSFSGNSENPTSFGDYGLDAQLKDALHKMNITTPSVIQNKAIPVILEGRNTLCAAETGSGKTLAYLLPILQSLLFESRPPRNITAKPGYPRVVVIVPARELAQQVFDVVKILVADTNLCVKYIQGSRNSMKSLRSTFKLPLDVIVSTPGVMLKSLREEVVSLEYLRHIVIDEVDTMLDDSFSKDVINILTKIRISESEADIREGFAQLTLVGATMPKQVSKILEDVILEEAIQVISTPQLHRIMPHVNQKFLRLHSMDKGTKIIEMVRSDDKAGVPVMVFCNAIPTCDWLARLLEENNIKVLRLHGSQDAEERTGVLRAFMKGAANVLVCTDVSSRGVDTIKVRHVINFDFPNHMSDYIHRVGRVGRVGSENTGHVTSFVVHKWDVDLVNKIERTMHARLDLPRVNANIKQKLVNRIEQQDADEMKQILMNR